MRGLSHMKIKIWIGLIGLMIFPALIFSAELFPSQCRVSGLRFSHQSIFLFSQHTAKPRLYAIQNSASQPIWLTHEKKNANMSAGFASQLFPQHWSVILITRRDFDLQCSFAQKSGRIVHVPCKRVIRVCQFSEFYFKNPLSGGFWVVENVLLPKLEGGMRARGFSFPKKDASQANSMDNSTVY